VHVAKNGRLDEGSAGTVFAAVLGAEQKASLVNELGRIEMGPDDGQTAIVVLVGAIDIDVSQKLRDVLDGISSPNVLVDMRETTFIDSVTIGTLVAARQKGRVLTLRGVNGNPLRVLEQTGVSDLFDLQH
jgi:anti-anti-sigma factor